MRSVSGRPSPTGAEPHAAARAWLGERGAAIVGEQVEIARTPAPPFQEGARAELVADRIRSMGLAAEFDEVGNLSVWYPASGTGSEPAIVIAAHLDTVFEAETAIEIRHTEGRWIGPGIADNARGIAVSLAVLRALVRADYRPRRPVLFAFTVGEEGRGDLRGVKHLFREGSPLRAAASFIAVDGSGLQRVIHHALACRRYRIAVAGAGGHSWTDWGRSNPAHAIGELAYRLARLELPTDPRTTLTVARLAGGTSINAIPADAWVELDVRSGSPEMVVGVERRIREALEASVEAERRRGGDDLIVDWQLIGERPGGALAAEHPLVRRACEATRALGQEPMHAISSTDANVPLSLGIPAVALGAGGRSGDTHTENEWFEDTDGADGALRLLDVLGGIAGD